MIPDFDEQMLDELTRPTSGVSQPQAPVLVIGRHTRFLDVQPTVRQAEEHLAQEARAGVLRLDACDFYDGVARPLAVIITDQDTIRLELAGGEARPETLRVRVNGLLDLARETYDPDGLPPDAQVGPDALAALSDDCSFPRFIDTLDRRFNEDRTRHVAGRLHNFWHAIT